MAGVESAHGGDKAHGSVFEELFAPPLPEGRDVTEYFDGCVWNCGLCCSLRPDVRSRKSATES